MDFESSNSRLLKKTIIYGIGNFGSKILSFLIVPFYSYYINTSDMGYYDIIITTVTLLQPIIILQMTDGIYRWLIGTENHNEQKKIIGTVFNVLFLSLGIMSVVFLLLYRCFEFRFVIPIYFLIVSNAIYPIIQQVARGLEENKLYAFCGIFYTMLMLGINFFGLVIINTGIEILIISQIGANIICSVIMVSRMPILRQGIFEKGASEIRRGILKYSIPLIPTTICWWLVNSSDRYIIMHYLGSSENGIYAMANKFPTILSTITGIFYLAWQESAILEYNTPHRDEFFCNIFKKYSRLLFSVTLFLVPATQIFIIYFLDSSYTSAWKYSGFLFLGVIFNSLSSFLGLGYQISKETKRSLYTTVFAAISNVVINLLLVDKLGLQAASLSTFLAYLLLFIVRIKHTKRYYTIKIDWNEFILYLLLCMVECIGLFFIKSGWIFVVALFGAIIMLYTNRDLIYILLLKLRGRKRK